MKTYPISHAIEKLKAFPRDKRIKNSYTDHHGGRCAIGVLGQFGKGSSHFFAAQQRYGLDGHEIGDIIRLNDKGGFKAVIAYLKKLDK